MEFILSQVTHMTHCTSFKFQPPKLCFLIAFFALIVVLYSFVTEKVGVGPRCGETGLQVRQGRTRVSYSFVIISQ